MNDIAIICRGVMLAGLGDAERSGCPTRHDFLSSVPRSDAQPAAALVSLADVQEGLQGGLGLVDLAAYVHDLHVDRFYCAGAVGASEVHGLRRLMHDAAAGVFRILIVSSAASFGGDLVEARRTFQHLVGCGVTVHSGREGTVTPDDFAGWGWR